MNAAAKPKTLNFPERDPRVVVGEYITANNQRILARMTIGTYEMSVAQQENAGDSAAAAKAAITALAKERGQPVEVEKSREFIAVVSTQGEGRRTTVWITTPLEPTQSGHLCWARIREDGAERRIGIAWKLANEFSMDDVLGVVDKAEKALRVVPEGEAYVLSGNPPPRFAKKKPADAPVAEAAAVDAPAAEG
jgi:hypothetical protein